MTKTSKVKERGGDYSPTGTDNAIAETCLPQQRSKVKGQELGIATEEGAHTPLRGANS